MIKTELFTVTYFFVRSSEPSAYWYGRPCWFHMQKNVPRGRASGFIAVGGGRREKSQTGPRPLSRFDTHPRWPPVTISFRSQRSYGKLGDRAQSKSRQVLPMSTSNYGKKIEPVNIVPSEQWRLCYGRIFGVSRTHSYGKGLQTVHPQSCLMRLGFENPEDPVHVLMIHSSRYTEETYRTNNIAILFTIPQNKGK